MRKTKAKNKGSQKSEKQAETTSSVRLDSESRKNQQLLQDLESNVNETTDENIDLPVQNSGHEVENVNQISNNLNNEELLESPDAEHLQARVKTESEAPITPVKDSTANQHIESISSPQEPLILETIYSLLKCLQGSIEKIHESVDSLREEVNDLKLTTNSMQVSVDSKIMQAQPSNSHQQKFGNKQSRSRKVDFNTVTYLEEHGEEKLQAELESKDNTELTKIIRSERIKTGKDFKTLGREDMIKEIISSAKRRLKQGSVFLKY